MRQALARQHVQYFNHAYKRSGTLWERRFKSSLIEQEDYLNFKFLMIWLELEPAHDTIELPGHFVYFFCGSQCFFYAI
jgi:putative transposase